MIAHARRCLSGAILALIALLAVGDTFVYAQDKAALYKKGVAAFEAGDFEQAYVVWKPLAENGYAVAQYSLGKLFDRGGGPIEKNPFMAALWYRQAAAQGVAAARNNLAIMYAQGRGVPANPARAVELWHQAAQQEHPMAQFNLGLSYFNGDGVEADPVVAVRWFGRAAEAGVVGAQYALGQILRQGAGVPRDPPTALVWYDRAAEQGYGPAKQAAVELRESLGLPPSQTGDAVQSAARGEPAPPAEEAKPTESVPSTAVSTETTKTDAVADEEPAAPDGALVEETAAEAGASQQPTQDQYVAPAVSSGANDFVAVAPDVTTEGEVAWESLPATAGLDKSVPAAAPARRPGGEAIAEARLGAVAGLSAEAPPDNGFPDDRSAPPAASTMRRVEGREQVAGVTDGPGDTPPTEAQIAVVPPVSPEASPPSPAPTPPRRKPELEPEPTSASSSATPDLPQPGEEEPAPASLAAVTQAAVSQARPVGDIDFPPGTFSIWLASTADGAAAQDFWRLAAESYPNLFAQVEGAVRRVDLGEFGVYYRVLAGTWRDREAARQVCFRLRLEQPDAFCKIQEN
jgi:TPR repeat protein